MIRGVTMASSRFVSYFFILLCIIAIAGSAYFSLAYPREILSVVFPMLTVLLVVLSILMFLSGFYYYKAKIEDEAQKSEQRQREMLQKIVRKVAKGK